MRSIPIRPANSKKSSLLTWPDVLGLLPSRSPSSAIPFLLFNFNCGLSFNVPADAEPAKPSGFQVQLLSQLKSGS